MLFTTIDKTEINKILKSTEQKDLVIRMVASSLIQNTNVTADEIKNVLTDITYQMDLEDKKEVSYKKEDSAI